MKRRILRLRLTWWFVRTAARLEDIGYPWRAQVLDVLAGLSAPRSR